MSEDQSIHSINITPSPEVLQRIAQVIASHEKIKAARDLQEALWDNEIYYDRFNREENVLLAEALEIGLDHIVTQELERIQKIEEGLTNE